MIFMPTQYTGELQPCNPCPSGRFHLTCSTGFICFPCGWFFNRGRQGFVCDCVSRLLLPRPPRRLLLHVFARGSSRCCPSARLPPSSVLRSWLRFLPLPPLSRLPPSAALPPLAVLRSSYRGVRRGWVLEGARRVLEGARKVLEWCSKVLEGAQMHKLLNRDPGDRGRSYLSARPLGASPAERGRTSTRCRFFLPPGSKRPASSRPASSRPALRGQLPRGQPPRGQPPRGQPPRGQPPRGQLFEASSSRPASSRPGRRLRRGGCWEGREGIEFDKRVLNLIRNRS